MSDTPMLRGTGIRLKFQAPEQLRYQFRLLGATGYWSERSANPAVHFSNLAPGSYQFLVRAINADGLTSPTPASFAFTISSPPWRRWWFQALAAVLLAGLVYLWHRISMNRQLALERVRSRIATDLYDDIGASLARIAVMSEAVKDRVNAGAGDSQRMLANIAETSRSLVEGMDDIVWSIDPRHDSVGDGREAPCVWFRCARNARHSLDLRRGFRRAQGRALAGSAPAAIPDFQRSDPQHCPSLAGKECRAAHSGARQLSVGEIRDDGRRIAPDRQSGLGIGSMQARASQLGGVLQIAASGEAGTHVILHFPFDQAKRMNMRLPGGERK